MKLITTSPLERYDILTFGLRVPPRAAEARQSYYDRLQNAVSQLDRLYGKRRSIVTRIGPNCREILRFGG